MNFRLDVTGHGVYRKATIAVTRTPGRDGTVTVGHEVSTVNEMSGLIDLLQVELENLRGEIARTFNRPPEKLRPSSKAAAQIRQRIKESVYEDNHTAERGNS